MSLPYTDLPRPTTTQGENDLTRREETLRKEVSPFFLISPYDTVQKQVDKLGPSTATKTWLSSLVTELTNRGF
ncbi:MAG TPA: hypothetical protein VH593_07010 [Ktedonobacteraceae bacterium]|jgi:hypothetical protein